MVRRIGLDEHQFQFEWGDAKAAGNLRKHGVSFELASPIFGDPRILTLADTTHSESEERWFSIGLANTGAMLSVAYLWTGAGAGLIRIRLITARRATATEIRYYTESQ
ncbi:MAG: BrnT family toxin [Bryobacteraceae bacterium]|nr:BrnT family toxin [Bryobacteraceae bacterium]